MKFSQPLSLKFAPSMIDAADTEVGVFTAYANTFNRDRVKDIVQPGASADSIKAMDTGHLSVPLLWQHDQRQPIGVILSASEDDRGLLVDGQIVIGAPTADRAYRLMKKGALSLSIGFDALDFDRLPDGGHLLKRIDLRGISLVSAPANAQSTVLSVRSLPDLLRSDWERMWSSGTLPPVGNRGRGVSRLAIGEMVANDPRVEALRKGEASEARIKVPGSLAMLCKSILVETGTSGTSPEFGFPVPTEFLTLTPAQAPGRRLQVLQALPRVVPSR